jgi:CubicO group peptidase (beta-lactamase class C family)
VRVGSLREIVRDARARTGVPGVAVGVFRDGEVETCADGVLQLGGDVAVRPETPFRIASISKPFTASLALSYLPLDEPLERWLSHTAGFRCESETPLPAGAEGLFSYSNTGYWAAGREVASALGTPFEQAMRERILEPLGLAETGYDDPGAAAARGHLQEGETGHRAVPDDAYPVERRPSGGLWSTVADLLRFAAHHLGGPGPLADEARAAMREPRSRALGAGYGLGWWVRDAGGRAALDHEGSVAGYQSLLLLVPEDRFALAVLTNSWRGSGLIRRVVEQLGLAPAGLGGSPGVRPRAVSVADVAGRYALDAAEAVVEAFDDALIVEEVDVDPVTGSRIATPRYPASELGDGVFGVAGGLLMSHRLDFPRPGFGRIGWVVLPRVEP